MRKLSIVLVFLLVFSLLTASPQVRANSRNYWAKSYGGSGDDVINDVKVLSDGSIIAVGYTNSSGVGGYDAFVMKLNPDGSLAWAKTYGGSKDDSASSVAIGPNGDIIVAGWTESFGAGKGDVWILGLDEDGNIKWQKTYGGKWNDWAKAVAVAPNGDIIVAGYTGSFGAGDWDVWVLRLDENGNIVWQKTYGGSNYDEANAIALTDNGDIIVTGETWSFGIGEIDVWVLRLDENGNVKWQKTYGGSDQDWANSVAIAPNGDVIVAGVTNSFGTNGDMWVLRLDENGNVKWQKTYGGSNGDKANAVAIADNGDILVAGEWGSGCDFLVLRLDENGNVKWQKLYGKDSDCDEAHAVVIAPNGDIIVAGTTEKPGTILTILHDAWILRLPPDGNLPGCDFCKDTNAQVSEPYPVVENSNTEIYVTSAKIEDSTAYPHSWYPHVETQYGPSTLSISSQPSGVGVYINGTYKGRTPLTLTLSPGTYRVELFKGGYWDYTTTVTLSPMESRTITAQLIPKPAVLSINSDPAGAKVYINGTYEGITPLNLTLSPGTYRVKLSKEDYEDYTTTITLSSGESKTLSPSLSPLFGYLSITSPEGARVYVDGSFIGTTPITGYRLPKGAHELKLIKEGYQEYSTSITITVGKTLTLNPELIPLLTTSTTTNSTTSTSASGQLSSPLSSKLPYALGALILLAVIGGVAAKARGTRPSSSLMKPAGMPKPPKIIPGFPPELLSKYEPLEFLGEGGFAKVFKVRRKSDGKIIALKVSPLDEKARKFFLKEVKAWRLLDHPNIVKLYNAFDEPVPHLEIEFIDGVKLNGKTIRDLSKYPKPVDENTALKLIKDIAEGLKHAHSKQVFHRDLKPQNVLITSNLTPKITDWGLAKVGAVSTTATTTKGLTLLYAAPEQLDEETYGHTDARTDIYQLGLIFYELLTGELPYTGTSHAVVMAKVINPEVKPKLPSYHNKELSKYDGIFEKLLAKRKEDRYQSVEEFLNDLELLKKLEEERRKLAEEIEKTKTTMSLTTNSRELKKLKRQLVEQLSRNAILHAQLNDKAGLINALEDLKAFSKEHRDELENAISQLEVMMRESVPISESTIDELRILMHKVEKEAEQ